jgi:hypothetical protein
MLILVRIANKTQLWFPKDAQGITQGISLDQNAEI